MWDFRLVMDPWDEIPDLWVFCKDNCRGLWYGEVVDVWPSIIGFPHIECVFLFTDHYDAIAFKLRWCDYIKRG